MRGTRFIGARLAAVLALVPLLLTGCSATPHPPYPRGYDPDEYGSHLRGWARVADSPLTPRHDAVAVAVGATFLVLGGRSCRPARCAAGSGRALRDGAAFDPATNRWKAITKAPVPVAPDRHAVLGTDLYIATHDQADVAHEFFLRYDTKNDSWTRLPSPPGGPGTFTVGGGGFTVISVAESNDGAGAADATFYPETNRWESLLPHDPIGTSTNRRMFWADGDLVLFAQPPGKDGRPSRVRSTTIWSSRGWDPAYDLPLVGSDPVFTVYGEFVFPQQGQRRATDGRLHPNGGVSTSAGWPSLPTAPPIPTDRTGIEQPIVLGGSVLYNGLLLDPTGGVYTTPPRFPGAPRTSSASAASSTTLLVWGGQSNVGTDLDDGYLLYP